MKTTTQERIDRVLNAVRVSRVMSLRAQQDAKVAAVVEQILREQDRDTRHACAEAVLSVYTGDTVMTRTEIVNAAHAACMNTRSI